jgi:uncharacterized protein (UPF0332 family)
MKRIIPIAWLITTALLPAVHALAVENGNGSHPESAVRSYYAMFYSVEALLLAQDFSFSKHSAVISAFGKNFIKTGLFDAKFHMYILDAFDLRNIGDYGTMHLITEKKATELIRNARELLDVVQSYLN